MNYSIFIGYRREDTADIAGRIQDKLHAALGAGAAFKDVDALPVGVDFGAHILTIVPRCKVFLALIGPDWLEARGNDGSRRLDAEDDWVRIELETALAAPDVHVVPVLTNGAAMPSRERLPLSLQALSRLQTAVVRRDPDFHKDMDKLIAELRPVLTADSTPAPKPLQKIATFQADLKAISAVAISPDGEKIAGSSTNGAVRLWSREQDDALFSLEPSFPKNSSDNSVRFSADGRSLLASDRNTVRVARVSDGEIILTKKVTDDHVLGAAIQADSSSVAIMLLHGTMQVYALPGGQSVSLPEMQESVRCLEYGDRYLAAGIGRIVRVWDTQSLALIAKVNFGATSVHSLKFSEDAKFFVCGCEDGVARVWSLAGELVVALKGHKGDIGRAIFAPGGARALTVSEDCTLRIWNVGSGREEVRIGGMLGHASAEFSRDGRFVLTSRLSAELWSALDGRKIYEMPHYGEAVLAPDQRSIIVADSGGEINVWDVADLLT